MVRLLDKEKQDAIIRKIEVAGEATKRLSEELKKKYCSLQLLLPLPHSKTHLLAKCFGTYCGKIS